MAEGAQHLKERVSDYLLSRRSTNRTMDGTNGVLSGNWCEERFDSRLISTGGKRAALPTELDHTWRSTYNLQNASRVDAIRAAAPRSQIPETTATLLQLLSGEQGTVSSPLTQAQLLSVVDGRHRAFPGHQPEQDLPGKDGVRPSDVLPTTLTRASFISPEEQRRQQQVNAADLYCGPAHDKPAYVVFKLQQALHNRGISAREAIAAANSAKPNVPPVLSNFSFPGLRRALFAAEREPYVPCIAKTKGYVTMHELGEGLAAYGVPLEPAELLSFFKYLDRNGVSEVSVVETVATIRGSMNDRRRGIVMRAFDLIEATVKSAKHIPHASPVAVTMAELLELFDSDAHPDVRSGGTRTPQGVRQQLFEDFLFDLRDASRRATLLKRIVTREHFVSIYEDWSALVAADHYFERSVRDCWHLSGGEGLAQNSSCRIVQVVHTNGRITQEQIVDDLAIRDGDDAAMRANLEQQGIHDVKTITVLRGGRSFSPVT